MRRSDREIVGTDGVVAVMKDCDVCRIAFNTSGAPYILPLNFGMSVGPDGMPILYFHGASEGTKYGLMEDDPAVSFEMDCSHRLVIDEEKNMCTMEYRSVIGHGVLSEVEGVRVTLHPGALRARGSSILSGYRTRPQIGCDGYDREGPYLQKMMGSGRI